MLRSGTPRFGCLLFCLSLMTLPLDASGSMNLFTNFDISNGSSEILDKKTGESSNSKFSQFRQLYNLDLSSTITPNVIFRGGGIFELDDQSTTTNGSKTDSETRTIRPFVEMNLNTPLYTFGAGYRKGEIRNSGSTVETRYDLKEDYTAFLSWRPVDLPRVNLSYALTNVTSEPKTVDTEEDVIRLNTSYDRKGFTLSYAYYRDNNRNNLTDFSILSQNNVGRAGFSHRFLDGHLSMNSFYTVNLTTSEFSGSGAGVFPVSRSAGMFSLNNLPGGGPALDPAPGLIDGNLTASAGIDIGTAGDQTTLVNIGVDLGFPSDVDRIYLWVDRALPTDISGFFSWEVYTSPDNSNDSTWTLHAVVFPATFGRFQNRFEIAFPTIKSRFIKVVARALNPVVVGASGFQHIFVTEMETLVSIPGQEGSKISDKRQQYSLGMAWKATNRTSFAYDLFYNHQESSPSSAVKWGLSNGASVQHVFGNIFSGSARLQRTDQNEQDAESVQYNYSALLRAAYFPTFTQIVSFGGSVLEDITGTSRTHSLLMRNVMQLYQGWSANLDASYGRNEPSDGSKTDSIMARVMTSFAPNQVFSLNLNYSVTWAKRYQLGSVSGARSEILDLGAQITPTRNLSFFSKINMIMQNSSSRTFQSHAVNWSPFQEGALQLSFNYNETFRSEENTTDKSMGPSARLDINKRIYLETSYNIVRSSSDITRIDSKIFGSNIKVLF